MSSDRGLRSERPILTKVDQEVPPSFALANGERHDATDVVGRAPLLFRKVADKLGPGRFRERHDVKQERLDVVVERLVIEELFRQQAKVLAVDLFSPRDHVRQKDPSSVSSHSIFFPSFFATKTKCHLVLPAIDFKHRDEPVTINFVARRMPQRAFELGVREREQAVRVGRKKGISVERPPM